MIGHKAGLHCALRFLAAMALATAVAGCGGSSDSSGVSKLSPDTGKQRREMDDYMKTNKPVVKAKVRNHP